MFRRTLSVFFAVVLFAVQVNCHGDVISRLEVTSEVGHRYAVTYVTAAVTNSKPRPSDLKFKLLLPWGAYVTTLTIESNGKNYTTIIRERRPHERRRPDPNPSSDAEKKSATKKIKTTQTFRASASVGANETAVFYLKYEELLQRVKGKYTHRLYLRPANKISLLDVRVRISETENITEFETEIPNDHENEGLSGSNEVHQERLSPSEILLTYREENITARAKNIRDEDGNNEENDDDSIDANEVDSEEDKEGLLSISYDVDRQADGGEIQILGGFFVHYFCPEGLPKLPTHTVFVLDISGSMYDFGKLDQLKLAMESILHSMKPEDSFEVLVFSTRVTSLGVFTANPKDVERGVTKIKRLHAMGGTNFNEALLRAILEMNNFNETTAAKQVVFLTDGKPNLGETKSDLLRRNVREANIHNYPIFSLGFGGDADMRLLRQVSTDNRGFTRKIDAHAHAHPADQLRNFYEEISTPLITDVDVMYLDDEVEPNTVVRQGTSTYYSGDEVVLAGQLAEGATEVRPIITGQGRSGPMQFRGPSVQAVEEPERDNYVRALGVSRGAGFVIDAGGGRGFEPTGGNARQGSRHCCSVPIPDETDLPGHRAGLRGPPLRLQVRGPPPEVQLGDHQTTQHRPGPHPPECRGVRQDPTGASPLASRHPEQEAVLLRGQRPPLRRTSPGGPPSPVLRPAWTEQGRLQSCTRSQASLSTEK
nr:inter-alpha-trypsin inhibitor heavy chain H5-like [Penaeus vannamei]